MKEEFDLVIDESGNIEAIYQDGLAEVLDAQTKEVRRASNVEWEDIHEEDGTRSGWTVRAAHDHSLAIRGHKTGYGFWVVSRSPQLPIVTFPTREEALAEEVKHFWELVNKEKHA